jgi:nicotinamide riboside kinase
MKRIVLTGAECTGKSTLAAALSGYYGEPWTPEFVRSYVDSIQRPLAREDLEPIAQGQLATEDAPLPQARRLILHDTNILSSILYAAHYFDAQLDWVNDAFLRRDYSIYLLCSPEGIDWQPDPGQRESPEARAALHEKFKESLLRLGLPHRELIGHTAERFGEAILAIDQLLLDPS